MSWVYILCLGLFVRINRIIAVIPTEQCPFAIALKFPCTKKSIRIIIIMIIIITIMIKKTIMMAMMIMIMIMIMMAIKYKKTHTVSSIF